jgi:hypothetical protein
VLNRANAHAFGDGGLEVEEMIDRPSHAIVTGRVKIVRVTDGRAALYRWRGQYSETELEAPAFDLRP